MSDVEIKVDAGQGLGDLPHNWNYIGYDEINYTYVPEGQALLAKFAAMQEKPYYVRAHHLFCTGNGHAAYKWGSTNAYLEDEDGQPLYDWTFVDLIFDTILQQHCKPFVELGFMPLHLADPACYDYRSDPSFRDYKAYGWACPPKDYQKWYDLVFALVQHCQERYGQVEIASWYWELWNEPDLNYYWRGSIEDYNKLYDYSAAAVKAACPDCRVGGPGTTNPHADGRSGQYLDSFLNHCANGTNAVTGQTGTPLDFVTFHVKGGGYRPDPLHRKQNPPSVQRILQDTQTGYEILSQLCRLCRSRMYPLRDRPRWLGRRGSLGQYQSELPQHRILCQLRRGGFRQGQPVRAPAGVGPAPAQLGFHVRRRTLLRRHARFLDAGYRQGDSEPVPRLRENGPSGAQLHEQRQQRPAGLRGQMGLRVGCRCRRLRHAAGQPQSASPGLQPSRRLRAQ